ncbi:S9 family peptidase [Acetanaerobacterium sp. MSJ-12]|nr:S9 family peptidase [Acetanaerobacterium sp. MSJ-12]
MAMVGQNLQEVYRVEGDQLQPVTAFNRAYLEKYPPIAPQHLTFADADGVEVDGWVLVPRDLAEGERRPAILDIHGGPKAAFGEVYYHEIQLWASQGYFVFYCNPRGSEGKGNAFAELRGAYGTYDYDDLMQFCDLVLERYPAIDEGRVGVTGGSYGGFMTNWIIGHTDRFRAAASQRSISNWLSFTYICDIGYWFGTDQMAADAWSDAEKLWWHSPLKYADNCKTPTLFIHSDEDYRCWIPEGYQMFTALKLHGVETRMCVFHGENHELSRSGKPEHRIRRLDEITAWFDRHLEK